MSFSITSSNALRSTTRAIKKWPKVTLYGDANMRPHRNIWMLEEIGLPYNHIVCKPWSRVAKSVHPLGKVPALSVECCDGDNNGGHDEHQFVILESAAINTFLGDLAREQQQQQQLTSTTDGLNNDLPMLVPPPATPERAKYDSLVLFIMTEIDSQSLWIHRKHDDLSNFFGEAPIAVQEARRQFDKALDVMVDEIIAGDTSDVSSNNNNNEERYLLRTGFSAVDILLAHCCSWAQRIGWLGEDDATTLIVTPTPTTTSEKQSGNKETPIIPKPLAPVLAAYLKRCRSRPAFRRADELRKMQVYEKKKNPSSKL